MLLSLFMFHTHITLLLLLLLLFYFVDRCVPFPCYAKTLYVHFRKDFIFVSHRNRVYKFRAECICVFNARQVHLWFFCLSWLQQFDEREEGEKKQANWTFSQTTIASNSNFHGPNEYVFVCSHNENNKDDTIIARWQRQRRIGKSVCKERSNNNGKNYDFSSILTF